MIAILNMNDVVFTLLVPTGTLFELRIPPEKISNLGSYINHTFKTRMDPGHAIIFDESGRLLLPDHMVIVLYAQDRKLLHSVLTKGVELSYGDGVDYSGLFAAIKEKDDTQIKHI